MEKNLFKFSYNTSHQNKISTNSLILFLNFNITNKLIINVCFFDWIRTTIITPMIGSVFRPPKGVTQNLKIDEQSVDNFVLFQIIFMKIFVVCLAIFLPLFMKGDTTCFFLTISIAFQFWTNKNLARTFLKAHWFVDTTTQKDRWIFEAKVKKPDTYESLFWFSSIIYMILLAICLLYYVSRSQLSLSCAILIGLICAYLNFFAYSKIMKARNEGILEKISAQVDGSSGNQATIQLPLITVRSQLKQIYQDEEQMYMS